MKMLATVPAEKPDPLPSSCDLLLRSLSLGEVGGEPWLEPARLARHDLESRVRRHLARGEPAEAAGVVVELLGPGILGYLFKLLDEDEAQDVYSDFQEHLLCGLPGFRWECTLRAWAYLVAQNCYRHLLRDAYRRRRKRLRTSSSWQLAASAPASTGREERLRRMRECLRPDEQTLLTLRLDRGMTWEEVPGVLSLPRPVSPTALRKRFQRIRAKVERKMRHGLVS